jgi:hypothetical protein
LCRADLGYETAFALTESMDLPPEGKVLSFPPSILLD